MSCILCFFDNSYQKKLKRASYNIDTFVERLVHYKNSFMEHFRTLQPITECDCGFRSMTVCDPLYVAFCEEVRKDFQTKETYVEQLFDSLIDIYQAVVAKSPDAENKFFRSLGRILRVIHRITLRNLLTCSSGQDLLAIMTLIIFMSCFIFHFLNGI